MGRRTSLAALAGAKVEDVPGSSASSTAAPAPVTVETATAAGLTVVQRILLSDIVPTPLNSRKDFGSDDELREFGESLLRNQLQAVVLVPRVDYLKLWPEHEAAIANGEFVLAAGERRWRGLTAVDGGAIDGVVRPAIAQTKLTFLDAVFTENFARKNLDYIEEANAIEELVKVLGTARAVAEHYKKTEGWASQRRSLLKLTLPMQHLVSSGELPLALARDTICKLPPQEQERAWLEWKNTPAAPRKKRSSGGTHSPASDAEGGMTGTGSGSHDQSEKPGDRAEHGSDPAASEQGGTPSPNSPSDEVPPAGNAGSQDFTAVKSGTGQLDGDQPAVSAVPAPRDPRPLVISVDLADIQTSAKTILEALSPRESYALVSAIVDSLRDDPEFAGAG